MGTPTDQLEGQELAKLETPEQVTNYIREKIQHTAEWTLRLRPDVTLAISATQWQTWFRRMMIDYGRALGRLEMALALAKVTPEMFKLLQAELRGALLWTVADAEMGS